MQHNVAEVSFARHICFAAPLLLSVGFAASCGRYGFDLVNTGSDDGGIDAPDSDGSAGGDATGDDGAAESDAAFACVVGTPEHPTVQSAIDDVTCDIVSVPPGTWEENLVIARNLAVEGTGAAATVLSGADAGRVVQIDPGASVTMRGLMITLGIAPVGGGIDTRGPLLLENVRITANRAEGTDARGAGLAMHSVRVTLGAGTEIDTNALQATGTGIDLFGLGAGIYAEGTGAEVVVTGAASIHDNTLTVRQDEAGAEAAGGGVALRDGAVLTATAAALTVQHNSIDLAAIVPTTPASRASGGGIDCNSGSIDAVGLLAMDNQTQASIPTTPFPVAHGGAIATVQCTLALADATITGNHAYAPTQQALAQAYGGGIYAKASTVTISGSTFSGNEAYAAATGSIPVRQQATGGGLYVAGGTVSVVTTNFTNNTVFGTATAGAPVGLGGAIAADAEPGPVARLSIDRCTLGPGNSVTTNSSGDGSTEARGGGLGVRDLQPGTLSVDVVNSTVSGNSIEVSATNAVILGGGVAVLRERSDSTLQVRLIHTTISDNNALGTGEGGGIAAHADTATSDLLQSQNAIIYGNSSSSVAGANCVTNNNLLLIAGRVFIGDHSDAVCATTILSDSVLEPATDPQLALLADNGGPTMTHAIDPASAARDTGPAAWCIDGADAPLTIDQRGEPRTNCDVGSFEVQ